MTLAPRIIRSSELYPERTAIVCTHEGNLRKSFADVKEDVDRLAAGFVALGMEKGDRIGIWVRGRNSLVFQSPHP